MSDNDNSGRFMSVLAVLLLLTLGAMGWWVWTIGFGSVAGNSGSVESLIRTQAADIQVGRAMNGRADAWEMLAAESESLSAIKTVELDAGERAALGAARKATQTILEGRGDVLALAAIADNVASLVPQVIDATVKLESVPSVAEMPAVVSNLKRLRTLARSLPSAMRGLIADDQALQQQIIDAEMELHQIVRSLQVGDAGLGLPSIQSPQTKSELGLLARSSGQLATSVADGLKLAEILSPVRESANNLEQAVLAIEANYYSQAPSGDVGGAQQEKFVQLLGMLGVAALLLLGMAFVWFRGTGQRDKAAVMAAETERDQQAILQLLDELGDLADGDLTVQATVTEDITGAIADSINFAIEAMRELVTTIKSSAMLVEDATQQTEASASALSRASQAQSRQIKEATEAIQKMAASIDEVSGNAERSADVARHSVDIAHKGGDAVRRTIEGMNTIRETIQDTSKRIKRLGESTQEIGNIVEIINDIADQTNILALNASIQASMAGEAGRGFAVVADEVQRLAERSTNATKQIEVLVTTIQADTNEAVVSMERSTTDVVGGALLAENAGAALEEIEQVSNQIAMLVQNISSSAHEQSDASRQVLQSADKLKASSHEADVSAATTTNFISKLSTLAKQLRESVSGFVLPHSGESPDSADGGREAVKAVERTGDFADYNPVVNEAESSASDSDIVANERIA